jgi:hypothetical protein
MGNMIADTYPSTINNLYSSIVCSLPHDSAQHDSANREKEDEIIYGFPESVVL